MDSEDYYSCIKKICKTLALTMNFSIPHNFSDNYHLLSLMNSFNRTVVAFFLMQSMLPLFNTGSYKYVNLI